MKSADITRSIKRLCVCAVANAAMLLSPALALGNERTDTSFGQFVVFAQASASANQPDSALSYYTLALHSARGDETRQRVALFGIGHMLLWLGRYPESESVYRSLLATRLSPQDHDVALAGLVKSLVYEGRPMAAFAVGATHETRNAELIVATANAGETAGWPDKGSAFLTNNSAALADLDSSSRLAAQLRSVRRDIANDLGPVASLGYDSSADSDGLRIGTASAAFSVRAGTTTVAHLSFVRDALWQGAWSSSGSLVSLGASSRFGDHVWMAAGVGSQNYPGWQTGTYDTRIWYRPDDRYGFGAFGMREAIQTQAGLVQHATSSTLGLTGEAMLGARTTISGATARQFFSDRNNRFSVSGDIGAVIDDANGLSGHLRWRSFSDSLPGSASYFNPQHYGELRALVTESRRIASNWRVSLTGGIGEQSINPGGNSTTASYDASVIGYGHGCIGGQASLGYSNSAVASSSGYQRHYAAISMNCRF